MVLYKWTWSHSTHPHLLYIEVLWFFNAYNISTIFSPRKRDCYLESYAAVGQQWIKSPLVQPASTNHTVHPDWSYYFDMFKQFDTLSTPVGTETSGTSTRWETTIDHVLGTCTVVTSLTTVLNDFSFVQPNQRIMTCYYRKMVIFQKTSKLSV